MPSRSAFSRAGTDCGLGAGDGVRPRFFHDGGRRDNAHGNRVMPGPTACEAGIALTRRPANDRCPASDSAGADGPDLSAAWLNCPGVRANAAAPPKRRIPPSDAVGAAPVPAPDGRPTTPALGLSLDGGSDGYVAILPDHRPGLARRRLVRLAGAAGPRGCHASAGPVSPQLHSKRYQARNDAECGIWLRPTQAQAARSHARQRIGLSLLGFLYLAGAWLWSKTKANAVWRMRAVCTGYRPAGRHRSVWAGVCTRWARA